MRAGVRGQCDAAEGAQVIDNDTEGQRRAAWLNNARAQNERRAIVERCGGAGAGVGKRLGLIVLRHAVYGDAWLRVELSFYKEGDINSTNVVSFHQESLIRGTSRGVCGHLGRY